MKKIILAGLFVVFLIICSFIVYGECEGAIDLDISKIERTPGQSTFKVIATANRAGDCLKIAWTQKDLNRELNKESPEEITNKDIIGDIILISQKSKFNTILEESKNLYTYEIYDHGWTGGSCNLEACKEWGYQTTKWAVRTWMWPGPCYCIYQETTPKANFGYFSGVKSREGEAEILISGLKSERIHFGNSADNVNLENKITVSWRGDLLGGNWIGTPGIKVYKDTGGGYHLISEYYSTDEISLQANGESYINIEHCLGSHEGFELEGKEEAQNCINAYNKKLDQLLVDQIASYASSDQSIISGEFIGSDLVVDERPYSSTFPEFILTFDAEWAGVHWITGEPRVSCPGSLKFYSGETKEITLGVENIANKKGAFSFNLDCGDLSSSLSDNKLLFESGEAKELTAKLTYSTDINKKIQCRFSAQATREPSKSDECFFDVQIEKIDVAQPTPSSSPTPNEEPKFEDEQPKSISKLLLLAAAIIVIGGLIGGFLIYNKNKGKGQRILSPEDDIEVCHSCGHPLKDNAKFCTSCGEKQ